MSNTLRNLVPLSFTCLILLTGSSYSETDTLLQGEKLRDGGHLVSAFGTFRLGFFFTGSNSYLGIWYNNNNNKEGPYMSWRKHYMYGRIEPGRYSEVPVWVANRDRPILHGTLKIGSDGNLMISQSGGDPILLSSVQTSGNTSATLLDSGNLVLRELNSDGSVKQVLWESFDYPTDTLLPGMKIGINLQTGHTWSLTSWVNDESAAPGTVTFGIDPNGTNQLIQWWGGDVCWASGIWPNVSSNFSDWSSRNNYNFGFVSNENEKYFYYDVNEGATSTPMIKIAPYGNSGYENYFRCEFGKYPRCRKDLPDFYRGRGYLYRSDFQRGHVSGDAFRFNESENLNIYDCSQKCLRNCSCIAFASTKPGRYYGDDGTGCEIWSNITITASGKEKNWRDIYLIGSEGKESEKKSTWLIIMAGTILSMAFLGSSCLLIWKKYKEHVMNLTKSMKPALLLGWRVCRGKVMHLLRSMERTDIEQEILLSELGIDRKHNPSRVGNNSHELQFLDFGSVALATNNFASENKLGEGGFGPVYKGILADGQEVAIKRLSTGSRQGLIEFKNEVKVIAKLQHSNLVRLVGCCIEKEEKILIYEYMPNKSLDFFLFDPMNQRVLDWGKRFKIIEGIAQGLLYLHKYSRLKIIHRDLKASNILLDSQMNPKISDFGMAKIFGAEESKANTIRVVGTYGYMPPEYAIEGVVSTKSDVFSFGVLLLEIVSGKRNNSLCHSDGPLSLIVYAWELWRQERGTELIDPTIGNLNQNEALRCIHVGLLCVQEDPADRPSTLDVASMLYNEANQLPSPRQPAFYNRRNPQQAEIAVQEPEKWSVNVVSITETEAR